MSYYKQNFANPRQEADEDDSDYATEKKLKFHYGMIKGRIAETLIQEMFLFMGFQVYHYGMEHAVPGITGKLSRNKTEVAKIIRHVPDFLVLDERNGANKVYMVEVKFRASGHFAIKDLKFSEAFNDAYVIVVTKKHIKCLTVKELRAGASITPDCRNYLGSRKELNLDKEQVIEFCNFAIQFFQSVE